MQLPFEHKSEALLPWPQFAARMLLSLGTGSVLVFASLIAGMWGYHYFEGLSWIDALLNASMILSGMGPVAETKTEGGKVFASFYALYSGFAVLVIAGIAFGPVVHRLFHRLHIDVADTSNADDGD